MPANLANVLQGVWENQSRWMSWDGDLDGTPMIGAEAIPQGDPWGPLGLNIYMWCGFRWVERRLNEVHEQRKKKKEEEERATATTTAAREDGKQGRRPPKQKTKPESNEDEQRQGLQPDQIKRKEKRREEKEKRHEARHTIYMDDRTWTAGSPETVIDPVEAWWKFSELVLLQENRAKVKLSANKPEDLDRLRAEAESRLGQFGLNIGEVVRPELEVLGMATVRCKGRKDLTKDEKKRVEATKTTVRLITIVPLSRRMRRYAYKALAVPKLCYGWIAKALPTMEAGKIQTAISRGLRISSSASRALKGVLEGGDLYPKAVLVQRTITVLQTARGSNENQWQWKCKGGTLVSQVKKEMKKQGWKPQGPWQWKHEVGDLDINLQTEKEREREAGYKDDDPGKRKRTKQDKDKLKHRIREGFRRCCFQQWKKEKRREVAELKETEYDETCEKRQRNNSIRAMARYEP